jgi:hypothetical protein
VFVGSACATPRRLLEALEALAPVGVQLIHFLTDGAVPRRDGRPASHFRHRAFYIGRDMRELAEQEHVDYVPIALAEVPHLIANGRLAFDVALVQASPPDERGMCSLGVSVDIVGRGHATRAVDAEISPRMRGRAPRPCAAGALDHVVAVDEPIIEYLHLGDQRNSQSGSPLRRARIIDDGAALQIGLGRVPERDAPLPRGPPGPGVHSDVTEPPRGSESQPAWSPARAEHPPGPGSSLAWAMGTRPSSRPHRWEPSDSPLFRSRVRGRRERHRRQPGDVGR